MLRTPELYKMPNCFKVGGVKSPGILPSYCVRDGMTLLTQRKYNNPLMAGGGR
jgi:hypothetical protein